MRAILRPSFSDEGQRVLNEVVLGVCDGLLRHTDVSKAIGAYVLSIHDLIA